DLPALVRDPDVVMVLRDHILEDAEVGAEDLVHAPQHPEGVELVLALLGVDVLRLRRQLGARWMHLLAGRRQQRGQRRLGEPLDLETRYLAAQLARDRDVAPGVAEADR